jgi:hypothetical protein
MKNLTFIFIVLSLLVITNAVSLWSAPAYPYPREFSQPNGVIFTGQEFGDDFLFWMETSDGYTFIRNHQNDYYCYAQRGTDGNLVATNLKVGIDSP